MTAAQKLLVNALVAAAAIARGQLGGNYESVVVFLLLCRGRLMTVEAIYTLARVHAHLVLMHDGVLGSRVAFRAFSAGAN